MIYVWRGHSWKERIPAWNDLVISGSVFNPTGLASPPTLDTDDGCYTYANGSTNVSAFVYQLPHGFRDGTISFHIHWCKTTSASGTVKWQTKYSWADIGSVFPDYSSLADGTALISDGDTANLHAIRTWAIDGTDKNLSSIIKVFLQRTSTGGADTYAAPAKLLSADLHIQLDRIGSASQWS